MTHDQVVAAVTGRHQFPQRPDEAPEYVPDEWIARYSSADSTPIAPDPAARARSDLDLIIAVSIGCVVIFLLGVAAVVAPDTAAARAALFTTTFVAVAVMSAFIWRRHRRPR